MECARLALALWIERGGLLIVPARAGCPRLSLHLTWQGPPSYVVVRSQRSAKVLSPTVRRTRLAGSPPRLVQRGARTMPCVGKEIIQSGRPVQ